MGGAPSAPQAPNPAQVSADQTTSNVNTAVANATLGNTNQVTPYGNLTYSQTGSQNVGGNVVPSYTATQTLSPSQQQIFNQTQALQNQALGIAPSVLNNVQGALNTQLPSETQFTNNAYNALTARTNQNLDLQTQQQQTQLANQGIAPGTDAYNNALRPIEQERTDASNQALTQATGLAGQNLAQAQTVRNQPLQDYSTLMGFGGGVTQPTYAPASAGQVAPTDTASNAYNSYNGQLQQYNTSLGQQNALMGGLFGLGGSGLGALGTYAAFGCDERLKTDIEEIGVDHKTGLMIYAFRYRGDPKTYPKVLGPMAQEVAEKFPGHVIELGGFKAVSPAILEAMGIAHG